MQHAIYCTHLVNQRLRLGSVRSGSRDSRGHDDDDCTGADRACEPDRPPSSLKDAAYRSIKDQLVSGQLEHDKIYSAQHFAAMLGVSRTPIREALLQLAGEGFLVCLEARGFKIKPFSEREIRDVFETRRMIETFVARQLIEKLTPEDIRQLKENLRVMAEHAQRGSAHGFMEADKAFHLSLVRCAGNQLLVSIMETIAITSPSSA